MTSTSGIPTPQEFFNQVILLNDKLAVHQACNELLDAMSESGLADSTISKKLTSYKKLFYGYQHINSELNETVDTTNGSQIQHIAGRLLTLNDEQKQKLNASRQESENARAGFTKEGDIREVDKAPMDIKNIIEKSLKLLNSNDPHEIVVGLLNLTGLRANELNMVTREYSKVGIIERDLIEVGEFAIAFKGISKKKNFDDMTAYFTRTTLAPAEMIVRAYNRFKSSKSVQSVGTDYEKYRKGFQETFSRRFNELFGTNLSTNEAYSDEGKLEKANGTPHKARAFYGCALRAILKAKGFKNEQITTYAQLCLAHENPGITIKYLGRYDESEFINPIDINIPINIKELGKMTSTTIQEIKVDIEPIAERPKKDEFDTNKFIGELDSDLQVKFELLMNDGLSFTDAVLTLINGLNKTKNLSNRKMTVGEEVENILAGILDYNSHQPENVNCIVPGYSLINKISLKLYNKSMAPKTVAAVLNMKKEDIETRLAQREIKGIDLASWNIKYHRGDNKMENTIHAIIDVINKG